MTSAEPHRITTRLRLGSTQALLIQAFAHLDAAQLPFLGSTRSNQATEFLVVPADMEEGGRSM